MPGGNCNILYDHRVIQLELNYITNESFIPIPTRRYDSMIIATTVPAAALIKFENPDLFTDIYRALRQIHYDCATKLALFFNETYWLKKRGIKGSRSTTDLPIRFAYFHNFNQTNLYGAAILGLYTWSQNASLWQSLSNSSAFQLALDNVNSLYPEINVPYYYHGARIKLWCDDSYAHGAFVLFNAYQDVHLKDILQQSVKSVHFIGEHISSAHGWIEGSILSSLRACLLVNEEVFDVAIVGGGPIGLATTINLANRNSSLCIVVIEQSQIGNADGVSGGSDTQPYQQLYDEEYLAELTITSVQFWEKLELGANLTKGI